MATENCTPRQLNRLEILYSCELATRSRSDESWLLRQQMLWEWSPHNKVSWLLKDKTSINHWSKTVFPQRVVRSVAGFPGNPSPRESRWPQVSWGPSHGQALSHHLTSGIQGPNLFLYSTPSTHQSRNFSEHLLCVRHGVNDSEQNRQELAPWNSQSSRWGRH